MYNSFLIFAFGANEDAAQQARHKLDGWKQAFRLDKKLLYKFERQPGPEPVQAKSDSAEPEPDRPSKSVKAKGKSVKAEPKAKPAESAPADGSEPPSADIKLLVRLYFSGHEKLSYQRWADRIPAEEPFKQASPQTVRLGDEEFADVNKRFDSLE